MRIHEAAKKYNLSTDDLIMLLRRAGHDIGSHMTGMTYDMVETVERFTKPRRAKKAKRKTAKKAAPKAKTATLVKKATPKAKAKAKATTTKKTTAKAKVVKKTTAKSKKATEEALAIETKPVAALVVKKSKAPEKKETPKAEAAATEPKEKVAKAVKDTAPVAKEPAKKEVVEKPAAVPEDRTKAAVAQSVAKKAAAAQQAVKTTPKQEPAKRPLEATPSAKPAVQERPDPKTGSDAQQKAVRESVRRTLAKMESTRRTKRRKGKPREDGAGDEPAVKVVDGITVRELAAALKLEPQDVLKRTMDMGVTVTINQSLDKDIIELIAEDLDVHIQFKTDEIEELITTDVQIDPARLRPRPPIVTVMGHVDHGKTSILDYIRKARVAVGEAGGITQHIGAYQVENKDGVITFIDTPGHEAFTSMRARGAQITDIVVLVVAADDGVMPQTIEAVDHARAANVPLIVAVNKIDLAGANPAQIKKQLTEQNVIVEEFGGEVVSVDVSAKTGDGIDKLLEMILLQAELLELKADKEATPQAVAVEVKKEEGRGILCTVLVTQGTLRVGDVFVVGSTYGKVRALQDHQGKTVKEAGPAKPVLVLGCDDLPEAGDTLTAVRDARDARELSVRRTQLSKEREQKAGKKVTLEDLYAQIQEGEVKELRLIVKADTDGSVEALTQSLSKLSAAEIGVKVIHAGVGVVSESDVLLASSSDALIIGFSIKISPKAKELAQREKVEIKTYDIIYEVIEEVDAALKGMLEPEEFEKVLGQAEVRKVYKISRLGQIAGSYVIDGLIARNAFIRVLRAEEMIHEGRISSLKRFQDDVKEVQKDFECGIGITGYDRLQEGDVIEAYVIEQRARII